MTIPAAHPVEVAPANLELDDPLLRTPAIAKMFDVKPETVRDWIKDGKMRGVRVNRSWLVRTSEVKRFGLERHGG